MVRNHPILPPKCPKMTRSGTRNKSRKPDKIAKTTKKLSDSSSIGLYTSIQPANPMEGRLGGGYGFSVKKTSMPVPTYFDALVPNIQLSRHSSLSTPKSGITHFCPCCLYVGQRLEKILKNRTNIVIFCCCKKCFFFDIMEPL